jgi:hypothetical protein
MDAATFDDDAIEQAARYLLMTPAMQSAIIQAARVNP